MQDKEYYAELFGIEPEYIDELVKRPMSYPSSVSDHFGIVHKVTIKRRGMEPVSLVEKISPVQLRMERGHKNSDVYEATVLRTLKRTIPRLPRNIHFVTPVFFDHRLGQKYGEREDRAIVTAFVPGTDFTEELDKLRREENKQRYIIEGGTADRADSGGVDKKKADITREKISTVRDAYVFLAVRALAEFHHYLREKIGKEIELELKKTEGDYVEAGYSVPTSLFDPRRQQPDFYVQRVVDNIGELLVQFDIKNSERCLERLRATNGTGRSPLNPMRALDKDSDGNIIISDYRPVNLKLIIDDSLRNQTREYITSGRIEESGEIQERILDSGKIGIMDLSDLRIGPPLLDFTDIVCDPRVKFRMDKRIASLRRFSDYEAMLRGELERAATLFPDHLNELARYMIYKALKGAVNTGIMNEKRFYLETLRGSLGTTEDFGPIREAISGPLGIMIERLRRPEQGPIIRRGNGTVHKNFDPSKYRNTPNIVPA